MTTPHLDPILEWERTYADELARLGLERPGARREREERDREGKEYDESQHPRVPAGSPEGGEWTESPSSAGDRTFGKSKHRAITEGVDMAANARRYLEETEVTDKEAVDQLASKLRDVPFVHTTSIGGLVSIMRAGTLDTRKALEDELAEMRERWADEIDTLIQRLPQDQYERLLAELDKLRTDTLVDVRKCVNFTRKVVDILAGDVPSSVFYDVQHAVDALKPIDGHTFARDRAAGLDRYVFGSMGAPIDGWDTYGNLFLVIDRRQIERRGGFITQEDIMDVAAKNPNESHSSHAFVPSTIRRYQDQMVRPADWARVAATLTYTDAENRSDPTKWEAKVAGSIPASAIIGIGVTRGEDAKIAREYGIPVKMIRPYTDRYAFIENFRSWATGLQRQRNG